MAQVTGLGGIFHKVADPQRTKAWYADVLGLSGLYGINLSWSRERAEDPFSLIGPFDAATDYFSPSEASFMINLRVDDLDAFVAELEGKAIEVLGRQNEDYGKFAWIMDCDGIKIELWQQLGPAPSG